MFRTFLICIGLMALIAAVIAGAVARANGEAPTAAASSVNAKVHTDAVKSASTSQAPAGQGASADHGARADKGAPANSDAGQDKTKTDKAGADSTGAVKLSGESVVGDQNAPKSLVLVPWKSAEIGKMPGLSMLLDDSVRPVDKDVFMRELAYYRIRTGGK